MKKQITTLLTLLFIVIGQAKAQQSTTYFLDEAAGNVTLNKKNNAGTLVAVTDAEWKSSPIIGGLKIDRSALAVGTTVKIESKAPDGTLTDITSDAAIFRFSGNQYTFIGGTQNAAIKILKISVKPAAVPLKVFDDVGSTALTVQSSPPSQTYSNWRDYYNNNHGGDLDIIKNRKRYYAYNDIAYICIDPYGNIIGRKPVNLDQDDEIVILMIVPNDPAYDEYSINDNDARYAPSDLSIRPMESISGNIPNSGPLSTAQSYTVKRFEKGPYTSDDVTFTIMKANTVLNEFTIHINPLYHLALGVSYVSTSLENPDYQVVPLTTTTNTIQAVNSGRRTFLTINAIWYWWSTLKYIKGSTLTRGRDVLKEPGFFTRINPTFGIGLKGNLENNFFTGFNFEFARGGSITTGWHYGKVTRLLDHSFQTGVTEFSGLQADIKTTNQWKWGTFIGVTLDSRIFNRLFSASKTVE